MKLGFISSILDGYSYEEMIDIAASDGLSCVEAACWPKGKAERRYGGVTHIDVENLTPEKARQYLDYAAEKKIEISALAYYPNPLDPDPVRRQAVLEHLRKVIDASHLMGVNLVTTFIGRDPAKTVEENLEEVRKVWPPVVEYAAQKGVRIAIENCPMLFGPEQWPGGQNVMTTPANWRRIFEILPYDNFGLNYDPSHFIWQMMDYIKPIYEFKDKLFHVHFKDIKLYRNRLDEVGIMAYPLEFMAPKLPGLGDIDWGKFVSALTDVGYNGYACIEVEDRAFEETPQRILDSLEISARYMRQFVI